MPDRPPERIDQLLRDFRLRRVSGGPFERPKLALHNLLRFDIRGAALGALDPTALSPIQRQTFADQWGVADGPFGSLLRIAENPLVLLGAILAIKFPVPLAKNLFNFAPRLSGLLRGGGAGGFIRTKITGNFDAIYHGLKVGGHELPEVFRALGRDVNNFHSNFLTRGAHSISKFESTGVVFDQRLGIALARRLEGKPLKPMGAAFEKMATETRNHFDEMYRLVLGATDDAALLHTLQQMKVPRKQFNALLKARAAKTATPDELRLVKRITGSVGASKRQVLEQLRNAGFPTEGLEGAAKRANYWPRQLPQDLKDFEKQTAALMATEATEAQYGRQMLAGASKVSSPHALIRRHKMVADPRDLRVIKDLLPDPGEITRLEARLAGASPPRVYSMKFLPSYESYVHSLGRAFGWTVKGRGRLVQQAAEKLEASAASGLPQFAHNKVRAAMLRDSYIPLAMGRSTYKQTLYAASFGEMKYSLAQKLGGLKKVLGKDMTDWLQKGLTDDRGVLNFRNIQGRLAGHFYVGALGGNVVSSSYNLMQTLLTTVPMIGLKATMTGLSQTLKKAPQVFRDLNKGISREEALARAFPQFGTEGLAGSPLTKEALGEAFSKAWETSAVMRQGKTGAVVDRVKGALMSLFQSTEVLVRLTAFEGTLAKGLSEGLTVAQAAPIASRVTLATQFLAGPSAVPSGLKNFGPLLRQFGTFPLRYADYLFGTAMEIGSGVQKSAGFMGLMRDKNLGTLGRAMLTGGLAYEGAREFLGQDISRGLIGGALPIPQKDHPFFPFPWVPPIAGLAGAAAADVLEGEFNRLQYQLPILVPGGVAASRFTTMLAPGAAEFLGRERAGYELKTADGRIPIFSASGSLRGYVTPMELYMDGLGFPPGGPQSLQREQELEAYLIAQRDRIRTIRRDFLHALFVENDGRKAATINEDYKALYPGFGGIQIRKQDIRAVQMRYQVARLEKALETLPADMRPLFGEIVQAVLLQEAENLLGVDPMLLTAPETATIAQRDIYRRPSQNDTMAEIMQVQIDRRQKLPPSPFRFPSTGAGIGTKSPRNSSLLQRSDVNSGGFGGRAGGF